MADERELIAEREKKVAELRAAGRNPYANGFSPRHTAGEVQAWFEAGNAGVDLGDAESVARAPRFSVAGRIVAHRSFGKAAFVKLLKKLTLKYNRPLIAALANNIAAVRDSPLPFDQAAPHHRIGGVHGDIERRQPILDDPLQVPGLEIRQRGEIAVPEGESVIVVANVEHVAQPLRIAVHKAEVAMVGAAADARRFERDAHREPLGPLHVVLDVFPGRQARPQHERVISGEEFPVQKVPKLPAVDRQQLRPRSETQFRAERMRRHCFYANHTTASP